MTYYAEGVQSFWPMSKETDVKAIAWRRTLKRGDLVLATFYKSAYVHIARLKEVKPKENRDLALWDARTLCGVGYNWYANVRYDDGTSEGFGNWERCKRCMARWRKLGKPTLAEAMPLYSVQCSQLGLKPDDVEKNLRVILQRANRWNAVLLLDEADVYIRKRGSDLQHNAIVGVFLRVLENASCILVMTTNIVDDPARPNRGTDDAIASRCIIRMSYDLPTADRQRDIWHNLAAVNKIDLSADAIDAFVANHPKISGRDVKNILKLASIRSKVRGEPVDLAALEFALQYKPTASQ